MSPKRIGNVILMQAHKRMFNENTSLPYQGKQSEAIEATSNQIYLVQERREYQ